MDTQRLKNIHDRATAHYEGKYPSGLFDINVTLDEEDKAALSKLLDSARTTHTSLVKEDPNYSQFSTMLDQMRAKLGTVGEKSRIIEDPNIQVPTKFLIDGKIPGIKVPTATYRLYTWDSEIDDFTRTSEEYNKGLARGRSAAPLGRDVRDIYRFVKEAQQVQDKHSRSEN